jgi:hypothetical protein
VAFSPQANYTDWATVTASEVAPTFVDKKLSRDQSNESLRLLFSVLYTGTPTFSFKQLLNYPHKTEWIHFQTHYSSENLVAARIEPGIFESVARKSVD